MKMIILKGLPASGKSRKAEELMKQYGNFVRINKDLLRTMLHFDIFDGRKEGITRDVARGVAKMLLEKGQNIIIDDTNLNPGIMQSWKDLALEMGAKIEIVDMTDAPVEVCVSRDKNREKKVGKDVIIQMAMQYGLWKLPNEKGIVCSDLDGTLADITHRIHFVRQTPKDWKGFFNAIPDDKPMIDIIERVMEYEGKGHPIIFVSARSEDYREVTEAWIEKAFNGYIPHITLLMRKSGDTREDTEVKKEMYEKYLKKYPIEVIFDDRARVVRLWKELGVNVIDVGTQQEF